jgi:DNA-binding transcriptional regulator YhcF (GntR family)
MNITIKQGSTVPIHRQLEEQIKQLIWNNQLQPGSRLPSVRELAGFLRINRNTIARAYEGLEREGFVQSLGAKGTFVSEQPPTPVRQAELGEFLSQTLQRAAELGLNPEQLAMQLLAHAQALGNEQKARKMLLVECNLPQLAQFRRELENALPVIVDTLLLDELVTEAGQRARQNASDYGVIVTTFFHADEVKQWLEGTQVELVSLLLQDSLPTLLKLNKLSRGTPVGLICESEHGLANYRKSLQEAGLERLKIKGALVSDSAAVAQALEGSQVVVCSSSVVKEQIAGRINAGVELICDDRSLDKQGIELLRLRLLGHESGAVAGVIS